MQTIQHQSAMRKYLDTFLITMILLAIVLLMPGAAVESSPDATAAPAAAVDIAKIAAGGDVLTPLINAATGKFGWMVQLVAIIGTLRVIFKPTVAWLHSIVDATPTDRDNQILAKLESSKIFKTFAFVLDWVASIKVGPAKPVPAVLDENAKK